MTAPTITDLPELPTFPPGSGLPDQPGVFIPQFLAFLAALQNWPGELNELVEYLEALGGGGSLEPGTYGDSTHVARIVVDSSGAISSISEVVISGGGGSRPLVNGQNPPVFIINDDHDLIMGEI